MCYEMFVRLWCGLYTALGVVVVRAQCGLYATSVKLLCGFLISRNAPELRSMGEKKALGVWIYSAHFVNVRHFEFGFAVLI